MHAWQAARPAIASMQVDLTTLPVLAELAIAAARLGEAPLVDSHLEAAWTLLGNLGHPASWSTGLRWTEIEAALLRNEPESVERHAHALEGIGGSRTAGRLARAGRTWAAVLAGDVAVDAVERAVDDLVAAGYPWDAGRLAGHAAGRAAEHHDTLHLLALARSVHQDDPDEPVPPAGAQEHDGARSHPLGDAEPRQRLSGREREVARLVLAGKTYVEIGEAIFISPRTAEHHIARIRRRLGASSRSDLMARLRLALEDD
jgi:DNA-binding CsgD family transcriptional regulator